MFEQFANFKNPHIKKCNLSFSAAFYGRNMVIIAVFLISRRLQPTPDCSYYADRNTSLLGYVLRIFNYYAKKNGTRSVPYRLFRH